MDRLKEALESSRDRDKERTRTRTPLRGSNSIATTDRDANTASSSFSSSSFSGGGGGAMAASTTVRRPGSSSGTRIPLLYSDHPTTTMRPSTSITSSSSSSSSSSYSYNASLTSGSSSLSEFKFGPRLDDSISSSGGNPSLGIFNFRTFSTNLSTAASGGGSPLKTNSYSNINDSNSSNNSSDSNGSALMALKSKNDDVIRRESQDDSLLRIFENRKGQQIDDLIIAAESGDLTGMQFLLKSRQGDNKSSLNLNDIRGTGGFSLLHYAASRGHINIVALLLTYDISIDIRNENQETPLHLAVYNGHLLVVDQLISNKADINARNSDRESPLFYAARRSMPAMIRLLLQRNADTSAEDDLGETAESHCSDCRCLATIQSHNKNFKNTDNNSSSNEDIKATVSRPLFNHSTLVKIFSYLTTTDICRCARVHGTWHSASESSDLCAITGLRRWRMALYCGADVDMPASASFLLKSKRSSKSN